MQRHSRRPHSRLLLTATATACLVTLSAMMGISRAEGHGRTTKHPPRSHKRVDHRRTCVTAARHKKHRPAAKHKSIKRPLSHKRRRQPTCRVRHRSSKPMTPGLVGGQTHRNRDTAGRRCSWFLSLTTDDLECAGHATALRRTGRCGCDVRAGDSARKCARQRLCAEQLRADGVLLLHQPVWTDQCAIEPALPLCRRARRDRQSVNR